jgi:UDP-N-acetylglucosamine 2-epimerase
MSGHSLRVMSVVGARPQFVKAAVVRRALRDAGIDEMLVHTGQHYDDRMSAAFFRELAIGEPEVQLGIGSATHGEQTGRMLAELERIMIERTPDRVLVYGDTNSTLAGALAASKLGIPVDHVEAGLRSYDRDMPEEQNRIVADHLADSLFCPTRKAVENLAGEGIVEGVQLVGDVMLDLALAVRDAALCAALPEGLVSGGFFVTTLHRASNTDDETRLGALIEALRVVSRDVATVALPAHPRLRARLEASGIDAAGLFLMEPAGYAEMQTLILHARGVITDSGGVQKEAFFHGVRCLTLRDTTEWPETVDAGMNELVPEPAALLAAARGCAGRMEVPAEALEEFGGGRAGERIAQAVAEAGNSRRRWRND